MHTVTKTYRDFPAAHRQHNHDGHCALIHGHNWAFDITFTSHTLDPCGFVVDIGKLDWLRALLKDRFDHTLLLNQDDPMLPWLLSNLKDAELAELVIVPNCGMEGLAQHVYSMCNQYIQEHDDTEDLTKRGVVCTKVVCWEDSKNSATYDPA